MPVLARAPYTRQMWADQEVEYLKAHYPSGHTAEIAARLNRPVRKVYAKANKLGIEKSEAYIKEFCRLKPGQVIPESVPLQYQKGRVPENKGLRRPGWGPGRMKQTQFKKGRMAGAAKARWRPIGTIMPDSEGYLRIKLRERIPGAGEEGWNNKVWKLLHRLVWEEANGLIPPKHMVVFRDKNRANCTLGNLELISMADNARRNVMWGRFPRELAEAIQLNGQLKRKIRRLANAKEQE